MKEKRSEHLSVETENLAVPEIRVSKERDPEQSNHRRTDKSGKLRVEYNNLAIPEVRLDNGNNHV